MNLHLDGPGTVNLRSLVVVLTVLVRHDCATGVKLVVPGFEGVNFAVQSIAMDCPTVDINRETLHDSSGGCLKT